MKKVFATLRALVEVMEALSKDVAPSGVGRLILDEVLTAIIPHILSSSGSRVFFGCKFQLFI